MSDAIKVLKKFVKDCNECCVDDVPYRRPVEDAINKAIIALEQKENDKRKDALDVLSEIGLEFFKTKNNLIKIRYSEKDLIEHLYFLYNEIINIKVKELKGVKK